MNRGDGLRRNTPLKATKPLQAKAGLARKPRVVSDQPCTEPKPAKPKRKTGKAAGEARARKLVYARSDGDCEVRIPGVCLGSASNWHHRLDRSLGGKWLASNGLHVCGSGSTGCHGVLTNTNGRRPALAARGWVLESWQNPLEVPVLLALHGFVLLDDVGCFTPSLPGVA